jgi:hypothetical protein
MGEVLVYNIPSPLPPYRVEIEDSTVRVYSNFSRSKGKLLKQWLNPDGYLTIKMFSKSIRIHQLVAELTLGPRPKGLVINHKDGNKLNNSPKNLEYCTINENIQHSIKMGFHVASDPKRNGNYIDGRSIKAKSAEYKHDHYIANMETYKKRGKLFYEKNRTKILERLKQRRVNEK